MKFHYAHISKAYYKLIRVDDRKHSCNNQLLLLALVLANNNKNRVLTSSDNYNIANDYLHIFVDIQQKRDRVCRI